MSELPSPSTLTPESTRVIVGMSGGVDSSVAAARLLEAGYQVEGLFMKNWNEDDGTEYCTAREDLLDAMQVAGVLGMELHTVNFAGEYWDRVFEHFLEEYRAGRTPNPDILCNKEIKFRAFLDHAVALGADAIATGHYARVEHGHGPARLLRAVDTNKDQTYFLHAVGGDKFARTLFPLGDLHKPEVRRLAGEKGFDNHKKKDSTGICFIGERRFKDFLETYLPAQPGIIEDDHGKVIGRHDGLMYYTLGQRQGLGIGGRADGNDEPWYVAAKDLSRNVLIAVQGHNHPLLFSRELTSAPVDWVAMAPPALPARLTAKTRYRQPDQACTVENAGDGRVRVVFDQPQRAVTPGQSVVFYHGDACLGGAVIEETR
ncbi:tRNA-specific 2-thiouridylase MnmA [Alloalcanivorax xenomutans]|uniref:tRNA 2-thiouridine(34) synthase MnmA n=1 Tax=Alloalcanivorax xenomutans TaxID=1094342 RepID=UPI0006D5C3D6|nr:tRNA 2-thiouridine(34) synthase MnmA [Alloalcanivorax xenomutans]PHS67211.1 MAG: tRNA 2-thiouridine(34) synthase MnmA [Alcanivorax sp.]CUR48734.1 tRNA-specific 2-thiouridylase MnmA [Alloalcanivorax xenomutans]